MTFEVFKEYQSKEEKASELLRPITNDLLELLAVYGHQETSHPIDRYLRGWGSKYSFLQAQGTYWEEEPESGLDAQNIHKIIRGGKPVLVKIRTLPCYGSDKDPDLCIEVEVLNMKIEYFICEQIPTDSSSIITLGKSRVISRKKWESCATELPQLIDWLKEKFNQRRQDIIDINGQIGELDEYIKEELV